MISKNDGPFNWVVGAFAMRDKLPVRLSFFNGLVQIDSSPTHTSASVFGQATYNFGAKFQLLAGARLSHDKKEIEGRSLIAGVPMILDATTESTEPTGKLALNFFPNESSTIYASISRGYKSGGMNDTSSNPTFDPESIIAYEAGAKTSLFGRRVRVSAAGFYYDYQDFQLPVFDAATNANPITNAGAATLYGAELEVQGRFGGLGFNLAASYTSSEISSLLLIDTRVGPQPVDIGGRPVNFAPEWTATAGVDYTFALPRGSLTARAQYAYTDRQYSGVFQVSPFDVIPSYTTVDASLRYEDESGIHLELFGKNLGDETYVTGNFMGVAAIFGAPRQYGLKAGYTF